MYTFEIVSQKINKWWINNLANGSSRKLAESRGIIN